MQRLDAFMSAGGELADDVTPVRRHRMEGRIEFRNVVFHYPGTTTRVLDDVSFEIAPGQKVAIVGRVGSGKSTIAGWSSACTSQTRRPDPDRRRRCPPAAPRRSATQHRLGAAGHDAVFGQIRENICSADPAVDDAELLRLARSAAPMISSARSPTALICGLPIAAKACRAGSARRSPSPGPCRRRRRSSSLMNQQRHGQPVRKCACLAAGSRVEGSHLAAGHASPGDAASWSTGSSSSMPASVAAQGPRDDVLRSMAVGQG
jgi:ATP-binding cassette, subfamily C, bacterial LapB